MDIVLRPGTPTDAEPCGIICHRAFTEFQSRHGFAPVFPNPEITIDLARGLLSDPRVYSVVAELNGKIVGSNFLHEHARIAGVGPTTVDPETQSVGIGRSMMDDIVDRANRIGAAGVRLVQEAYNGTSFSLYTKLGFAVLEPLAVVRGSPPRHDTGDYHVRPAAGADFEACSAVATHVLGYERGAELGAGIEGNTAAVVERGGEITGYTSSLGFRGHTVCMTNGDLKALISQAEEITGPGLLVPTRNSELVRWCFEHGFRFVSPTTLMGMGEFKQPTGAFLPSIIF